MQVANPAGAGTWTRREQFGEGHPHLFNFVRAGSLRAGHARPLQNTWRWRCGGSRRDATGTERIEVDAMRRSDSRRDGACRSGPARTKVSNAGVRRQLILAYRALWDRVVLCLHVVYS